MESVLMCATVKPLQFIPARGRKPTRAAATGSTEPIAIYPRKGTETPHK